MTWHERVGIGKRDPATRQKGAARWITAKRAAEERLHDITRRAQQARPGPTQEWTKAMNMTRRSFSGIPARSIRISPDCRQALDCGDSSLPSRRSLRSRSRGRVELPRPTGMGLGSMPPRRNETTHPLTSAPTRGRLPSQTSKPTTPLYPTNLFSYFRLRQKISPAQIAT